MILLFQLSYFIIYKLVFFNFLFFIKSNVNIVKESIVLIITIQKLYSSYLLSANVFTNIIKKRVE